MMFILLCQIGILLIVGLKGSAFWAWGYTAALSVYLLWCTRQVTGTPRTMKDKLHAGPPWHFSEGESAAVSRYPFVFDQPSKAGQHCTFLAYSFIVALLMVPTFIYREFYLPAAITLVIGALAFRLRARVDPRNHLREFIGVEDESLASTQDEAKAFFSAFEKVWPEEHAVNQA